MMSHSSNLLVTAKIHDQKLVYPIGSVSLESSYEEKDHYKDQDLKLRESPKKRADPEFSFSGTVVFKNWESETMLSKIPVCRRSTRIRKCSPFPSDVKKKKIKLNESGEQVEELLPCYRVFDLEQRRSSITDATAEEDVAFCLMMLSRNMWNEKEPIEESETDEKYDHDEEEGDGEGEYKEYEDKNEDEETDGSEDLQHCKLGTYNNGRRRTRGKYRCETCTKTFRSYQALGGHRASHKKAQPISLAVSDSATHQLEVEAAAETPHNAIKVAPAVKVHKCPYCSRVFSSGQALGGHKRSHTTGYGASITVPIQENKLGGNLIDLNLPAPIYEERMITPRYQLSAFDEF